MDSIFSSLATKKYKERSGKIQEVQDLIKKLEEYHKIKVIFATLHETKEIGFNYGKGETGVRFIYARTPEEYRMNKPYEVLDFTEHNVVFKGYDLPVAMNMQSRNDTEFYEIMHSPIAHIGDYGIYNLFIEHNKYFDKSKLLKSYFDLGRTNFNNHGCDIPSVLKMKDIKGYIVTIICVLQCNRLLNDLEPEYKIKELLKDLPKDYKKHYKAFVRTYETRNLKIGYTELADLNSYLYKNLQSLKKKIN